MSKFYKFFKKGRCSVIGMVHVGALPGIYNKSDLKIYI